MGQRVPKTNFNGGEVSGTLQRRITLEKVLNAVARMINFFTGPEGWTANRGGLGFINATKDSSKQSRLIPFVFSIEESYMIEMGDRYFRFYRNEAVIIHSPKIDLNIRSATFKWTASGAGANEYYLELADGGDPKLRSPKYVFENAVLMTSGALGALAAGEWGYGDNDALGYSTIYVRLTDNTDPDTKADGFLSGAFHTATSIVEAGTYKWTASGSGLNEYHVELNAGGDPGLSLPENIYANGATYTKGTMGALAAGEWAYGDNDALGYSTIYIRLSDNTDPDTKANGYVEASYIVEVAHPYNPSDFDLIEVKYTQSLDVLSLFHRDYKERELSRSAHDYWTLTEVTHGASINPPSNVSFGAGGLKYVVTSVNSDGVESVASTESTGALGNVGSLDTQEDAEYYNIYKEENASGFFGWIGQANTNTFTEPATGIEPDITKTPPSLKTPFSDAGTYPAAGAYHNQRKVLGGSKLSPQTIDGSIVGDFNNFNRTKPIKESDAYKHTLDSDDSNEIRWLVSLKRLIVGTTGGAFVLKGANGGAITPTSVDAPRDSSEGTSHIRPVIITNSVVFVDGSQRVIHSLKYSFEADGFEPDDLTIFAKHLFRGRKILDISYEKDPESILWAVRDDGVLLGCTVNPKHQVLGWFQFTTDGEFESVATLRNIDGTSSTYVIVKRTINGQVKRFVEILKDRIALDGNGEYDVRHAFLLDSGLTLNSPIQITNVSLADPVVLTLDTATLNNGDLIDLLEIKGALNGDGTPGLNKKRFKVANKGAGTIELTDEDDNAIDGTALSAYIKGGVARKTVTEVSSLDHLEGEKVTALADGAVIEDLTVQNGKVSLGLDASLVHVGLPYEGLLETLDFEPLGDPGTKQGKNRTIGSVIVGIINSSIFKIGPTESKLTEVKLPQIPGGIPTELVTGEIDANILAGPESKSRIVIKTDKPLPVMISLLNPEIKYEGR